MNFTLVELGWCVITKYLNGKNRIVYTKSICAKTMKPDFAVWNWWWQMLDSNVSLNKQFKYCFVKKNYELRSNEKLGLLLYYIFFHILHFHFPSIKAIWNLLCSVSKIQWDYKTTWVEVNKTVSQLGRSWLISEERIQCIEQSLTEARFHISCLGLIEKYICFAQTVSE